MERAEKAAAKRATELTSEALRVEKELVGALRREAAANSEALDAEKAAK